ncbi:MAG: GWxTD domain-containing protein [Bacteroidota bacterium]
MQPFSTTSISRKTLAALLFGSSMLFPQSEPQRMPAAQRAASISFEAIPLFSPVDSTTSVVHIHYRIRENFFIVLRNIESLLPNDFLAKGDLLIELRDNKGVSVGRHIRSIVLKKDRMPGENDISNDLQGAASFSVPPGVYSVFFNVEDRQSQRSFTSKEKTVTGRRHLSGFDVSAPVFVSGPPPDTAQGASFQVLNHGTDVFFGEGGGMLFSVWAPSAASPISAGYVLGLQPEFKGLDSFEMRGNEILVMDGIPDLIPGQEDTLTSQSNMVRYLVQPADPRWKTVYIPLPLQSLQPGKVQAKVDVSSGTASKTLQPQFRVLWLNQPLSLRDPDLAIDALQHIATTEELDALRSLSQSKSAQLFFDFWGKKDPDTSTAYNEMMAEYYRRVDAAIRQYSTPKDANGYKTDRGRILILYGTPTNNERVFSPTQPPREVWTYPTVKRRFVFEDRRRNGMYALIAVENL